MAQRKDAIKKYSTRKLKDIVSSEEGLPIKIQKS